MSSPRNVLAICFAVVALSACGSSGKTYFETEGLRAPEGACPVKPSKIGLASKISNIDEGNGCEVRNAWQIQSVGSKFPAQDNRELFDGIRDRYGAEQGLRCGGTGPRRSEVFGDINSPMSHPRMPADPW